MRRFAGRVVLAARASDMPRVRVAALIVIDGRILLVRQSMKDHSYHLLPGGGVRAGETLASALEREVAEETGLNCITGEPVLINDTIAPDRRRHLVNITFTAQVTGGALLAQPTDPAIDGLELVERDALASLDLRPPIARELLEVLTQQEPRTRYLGALWTDD